MDKPQKFDGNQLGRNITPIAPKPQIVGDPADPVMDTNNGSYVTSRSLKLKNKAKEKGNAAQLKRLQEPTRNSGVRLAGTLKDVRPSRARPSKSRENVKPTSKGNSTFLLINIISILLIT